MKIDTMVVLTECDTVNQAEMIKSVLEDVGIWSMINNEYMSTIYPTGIMPAQIIIQKENLERAQEILKGIPISEQEVAEE